MRVIQDGSRGGFDLEEFLSRRLFAHLSTVSGQEPRESPVWFSWEDGSLWIIGDSADTFPKRIEREPRCAIGIVDFDPQTGLVQHAGFRGRAGVEGFNCERARRLFSRYLGEEQSGWPTMFRKSLEDVSLVFVRFEPETVVVRDQSYPASR